MEYEKLFVFLGRYFLYAFLFSIPFLFLFFEEIMGKRATFNFWLASFIPQVLSFIFLCYKYHFFKKLKDCFLNSFLFDWKRVSLILIIAICLPFLVIFINYVILKSIDINFSINQIYFKKTPIIFILTFCSALIEELIFRFIPYELIPKRMNFKNIFIVNSIFCIAHIFNPNPNIIGLISILLAGVLLTVIYLKTNNIIYSTLIHTFWNFIIGPILGGNVSGIYIGGVFSYKLCKSNILSGGNYGMEGSIISVILLFLFLLIVKKAFLNKNDE